MLLLLGCWGGESTPPLKLAPGEVRLGARTVSPTDEHGLLDLILVPGPEKGRSHDTLIVAPSTPAKKVSDTTRALLYAGNERPVTVGSTRLHTFTAHGPTCTLPVQVRDPPMYTRIPEAAGGFVETKSLEALSARAPFTCGTLTRRAGDCARGLLLVDPAAAWGDVAVPGDWALGMVDPSRVSCSVGTQGQ